MADVFFRAHKDIIDPATPVPGATLGRGLINISNTSLTYSGVFNTETRYLRLFATGNCYYKVGVNPVVSATDGDPLGAENPEYVHMDANAGETIAIIER